MPASAATGSTSRDRQGKRETGREIHLAGAQQGEGQPEKYI